MSRRKRRRKKSSPVSQAIKKSGMDARALHHLLVVQKEQFQWQKKALPFPKSVIKALAKALDGLINAAKESKDE